MTTDTRPNKHGGRRPGAGRKRIGEEALKPISVSLDTEHIAYLEAIGDGNMSLGIRKLIEWHRTEHSKIAGDV